MSGHFSADNIGDGSKRAVNAEPASFAFDAQSRAEIDTIIAKYPPGRQASGVIPLLYVVQNQMRRDTGSAWVPRIAMDAVAARLEMPPIRVYEVATFYFMLYAAHRQIPFAGVHHHAVLAAWQRRCGGRLPSRHRHQGLG
jgi:hypothetical protein